MHKFSDTGCPTVVPATHVCPIILYKRAEVGIERKETENRETKKSVCEQQRGNKRGEWYVLLFSSNPPLNERDGRSIYQAECARGRSNTPAGHEEGVREERNKTCKEKNKQKRNKNHSCSLVTLPRFPSSSSSFTSYHSVNASCMTRASLFTGKVLKYPQSFQYVCREVGAVLERQLFVKASKNTSSSLSKCQSENMRVSKRPKRLPRERYNGNDNDSASLVGETQHENDCDQGKKTKGKWSSTKQRERTESKDNREEAKRMRVLERDRGESGESESESEKYHSSSPSFPSPSSSLDSNYTYVPPSFLLDGPSGGAGMRGGIIGGAERRGPRRHRKGKRMEHEDTVKNFIVRQFSGRGVGMEEIDREREGEKEGEKKKRVKTDIEKRQKTIKRLKMRRTSAFLYQSQHSFSAQNALAGGGEYVQDVAILIHPSSSLSQSSSPSTPRSRTFSSFDCPDTVRSTTLLSKGGKRVYLSWHRVDDLVSTGSAFDLANRVARAVRKQFCFDLRSFSCFFSFFSLFLSYSVFASVPFSLSLSLSLQTSAFSVGLYGPV